MATTTVRRAARRPRIASRPPCAPRLRATLLGALLAVAAVAPGLAPPAVRAADRDLKVFMSAPATLDPAAAGDAASSNVIAQFFEGLTALDAAREPQPALAERWEFRDEGRTVVFTLRADLRFSDGSPLTADDVVRSWLRVIDPVRPSPLASLLFDIRGAADYLRGTGDASGVGLTASGRELTVSLTRPGGDFPALAASPTMAVVPPGATFTPGPGWVSSGGYVPASGTGAGDGFSLEANPNFWAGMPAIRDVTIVTGLGGISPVDAFTTGTVDWVPVFDFDAPWIAYDRTLGPQLRQTADLSVLYYGFDTSRPPFNNAMVRLAFAKAVDWRRLVQLADGDAALPATSMVPPGMPSRSDTDFLPSYDPEAARRLLSQAGYSDPATFPTMTLVTSGTGYDEGVVTMLRDNLGISLRFEGMEFGDFFTQLGQPGGPAFWALSWIADYPSPNDFLGILLGSGQPNNYGRWENEDFDAATARAVATDDEVAAEAAYDDAQAIVRDLAPVIPVSYGSSSYLSREGLLGATTNGLGILRIAAMAWQE